MSLKSLSPVFVLLIGLTANAGSEHLIKQRAKDVRDQQNQRQGVQPASPPPPPTSSAAPARPTPVPAPAQPAAPAVSPQAARIGASLSAIQEADTVGDEQIRQLAQSLIAAARGPVQPSAGKIDRLAEDLSKALAGTKPSAAIRARLPVQLEVAFNKTFSAKEIEVLSSQIHDTLRDAGIGRVDAKVISNDVKSILVEILQGAKH